MFIIIRTQINYSAHTLAMISSVRRLTVARLSASINVIDAATAVQAWVVVAEILLN